MKDSNIKGYGAEQWTIPVAILLCLIQINAEFDCGILKLPISYFCDGEIDCEDGTDEIRRNLRLDQSGIPCRRDGFVCMLPENLKHLQSAVCLKDAECYNDEFKCTDGSGDNSDKDFRRFMDEKTGHLCRSVSHGFCYLPESQVHKASSLCEAGQQDETPYFSCDVTEANNNATVCDKIPDCMGDIDEKFCPYTSCPDGSWDQTADKCNIRCGLSTEPIATKCDGIIECREFYREECQNCIPRPEFCKHHVSDGYYQCSSKSRIPGWKICDGIADCEGGEEEIKCPRRFYCEGNKPINVPDHKVCNLQKDCEDSSDEMKCTETTHFYCNDTGDVKFISINELCDGSQDCKSGRDECLPECIVSEFSDTNSMIKNTFVLAIVWVTSTVTLAGNAFVIIFSIIKLFKKKNYKKNAMINKILICNLSASDFLVGVDQLKYFS
ncbi:uncharacterized protein LOC144428030 [Styela clava]